MVLLCHASLRGLSAIPLMRPEAIGLGAESVIGLDRNTHHTVPGV